MQLCADADANVDGAAVPLKFDRTTKLQLSILLLTNFLVQMGIGMLIVILPLFCESIGLGALGVGILVAVPQLTKLLFNLPVGHLVDVVGRKPPLIAGALLDAVGQFLTASATTISGLVPARLIIGVGSATGSVTGPATLAYTMDVVGKYPAQAGLLNGVIQAFGFLAFAIGPFLGGILAQRYSPKVPFLIFGVLQLVCVPLKMLLPETLPPERRKAPGLRSMGSVLEGIFATYRALLADKRQVALLLVKTSFLCGLSLILTIVPLHATAAWGASAADLGRVASLGTLLCLFVSPLAGYLADKVGRKPLAIGGSLVSALAVATMPVISSKLPYYFARIAWAVGEAFTITAYSTIALDVTPEDQRGARNSLDNQVGDVALLFLPVLFGVVGQTSFAAAFWLAASLMVVCNLLVANLLRDAK